MRIYKPKEFAEILGVTVWTLQNWDNRGILTANRSATNRRYYTEYQLQDYLEKHGGVTMSFKNFTKQYISDNSTLGDLARDVDSDYEFPVRTTSWTDIHNYLEHKGANDSVMDIAREMYSLYKGGVF